MSCKRNGGLAGLIIALLGACLVGETLILAEDRPPVRPAESARSEELAIIEATRAYPLLSGRESLEKIELADGFRVELVAAEPLVQDPVAFDWGLDGKLWVVEMADYPFHADGSSRPGGRIRVLEDTNGDGQYDTSTLFAENLSTPNGILTWRDGVLVTACPDLLYLEDTTGDGKADRIEKLFSGFAEGNQQHRVNGLSWGLDNWVYLANGDSGGHVTSLKTGQSVDIRGRDLRVRPDTGEIETQAGQTQFGRHRDDWGNWFSSNNPNPIFHFVLAEHYLQRNPHLVPPVVKRNILEGETLVFPVGPIISHCNPKYRPLGATPRFTSACSTIVYRDDLFGPAYRQVTFTSEPVYNIVHARQLIPEGVSFTSRKLHGAGQEFFRSADPWSRPTMLQTGPDGALYIADMVREVIEHPEWIDAELKNQIDLRSGDKFGRIYRIVPEGVPLRPIPDFSRLDTPELARILASPNGWQRDLAHRLLIWRADERAVPVLQELAEQASDPRTRVQALCTLEGMQRLTADRIRRGMRDAHPEVRCQAIRLSEQWADGSEEWLTLYRTCLEEGPPQVWLQLAYSLGEWQPAGQVAAELLADLATRVHDDPYLMAAVSSSLHSENVETVVTRVLAEPQISVPVLGSLVATATRFQNSAAIQTLLATRADNRRVLPILVAWFQALGGESQRLEKWLSPECLQELDATLAQFQASLPDRPLPEQVAIVRLLGHRSAQREADVRLLESFIDPRQPIELQLAAVATLAETGLPDIPQLLTSDWGSHGPRLRSAVLEILLGRPAWTGELLSLVEQGIIPVANLSQAHSQALRTHRDAEIRQRTERLLGSVSGNRDEVLKHYAQVEELVVDGQRDTQAGKLLFQQKCTTCHRLDLQGANVGPDLTTLVNRSPGAILTAVIDPNRAVESRYLQYQVVTTDGRVLSGLLTEETATTVTLVAAEAKTTTLLRDAIDVLKGSSLSMMPDGLEKDLSPDQMANLIHYVIQRTETHATKQTEQP